MKRNVIKKASLMALSALFAASFSVGIATLIETTADGTEAKVFAGGASVRVKYDEETQTKDDRNGIRFATFMQNVDKADIKSSITAIMPTDLLDDGETLTISTTGATAEDTTDKWYEYDDKTHGKVLCSCVVLYDVPKASYSREITWVTQVTLNDDTVLTMTPASHSLTYVAAAAEAKKEEEGFTAGQLGILEEYQAVAAENTYVEFEQITLTAGENTAAIDASPAFWSNYYKDFNTVSFSVKVDTAADLQSLTFTTAEEEVINFPISGLQDGVAKQIPFDYAKEDYGAFTKGTFTATLAEGSESKVVIAPMKASAVETETTNDMYAYSREDKEMRLGFVDMLKNDEVTADKVLSVKYNGAYVDFTAEKAGNNIVFASDILADVKDGAAGASFEIRTASKKYTMTNPVAHTKVFYEADDLFALGTDGKYYSYFDMSDTTGLRFPAWSASATFYAAKGIYALGADIVLSEEDSRVLKHVSPDQGQKSTTQIGTATGLTGTFEGYSHSITGMTVGAGGLFGHIGRGTVQNVAFKNVKYANASATSKDDVSGYSAVLAKYITGWEQDGVVKDVAKLNNIYISLSNFSCSFIKDDGATVANDAQAATTNDGLLSYKASPLAKYDNIVVDASAVGEINVIGRGLFNFEKDEAVFDNMNNTYFISSTPLSLAYNGNAGTTRNAVIIDAFNQTGTWAKDSRFYFLYKKEGWVPVNSATKPNEITYLAETQSIYRFENVDDLTTYLTNNNVDKSGFTASGWATWFPSLAVNS